MDALSDVLRVVRLSGGVFFHAHLAGPWAFRSPAPAQLAPVLGARADCLALFHILVEGRCWIGLDGREPLPLEAGSVVVLPHGDAHLVASRPDLEPKPLAVLLSAAEGDGIPQVAYGQGGELARFVCGYLHCDQRFNPLIGALPKLLIAARCSDAVLADPAPAELAAASADEADPWLALTLRHMAEEAEQERPGGDAVLARTAELLYVEILRRYAWQLPETGTGWLAGVRHREVGHALRLLHAYPGRRWTVTMLAREVGLSRSALAERFQAIVGEPPMSYLGNWRMQLAQRLLQDPALSIAQVAKRVGYGSAVAFHCAFRNRVGQPPGRWREASAAPVCFARGDASRGAPPRASAA